MKVLFAKFYCACSITNTLPFSVFQTDFFLNARDACLQQAIGGSQVPMQSAAHQSPSARKDPPRSYVNPWWIVPIKQNSSDVCVRYPWCAHTFPVLDLTHNLNLHCLLIEYGDWHAEIIKEGINFRNRRTAIFVRISVDSCSEKDELNKTAKSFSPFNVIQGFLSYVFSPLPDMIEQRL